MFDATGHKLSSLSRAVAVGDPHTVVGRVLHVQIGFTCAIVNPLALSVMGLWITCCVRHVVHIGRSVSAVFDLRIMVGAIKIIRLHCCGRHRRHYGIRQHWELGKRLEGISQARESHSFDRISFVRKIVVIVATRKVGAAIGHIAALHGLQALVIGVKSVVGVGIVNGWHAGVHGCL